jgi:hypothetical protein
MTLPENRSRLKEIDWTECDLNAHGRAWMTAREEFTARERREPVTSADMSAIAQRAEKIRRGKAHEKLSIEKAH